MEGEVVFFIQVSCKNPINTGVMYPHKESFFDLGTFVDKFDEILFFAHHQFYSGSKSF